ncbi:MAG: energy-coupling factor transporter ATPase [Clostridiales bacterium]|nr:energy-coupling factor transporter ATPase [Clostridiales bacterium]
MIKAEHISFRYGEEAPLVLRDINIEIPSGQWLAIIGANGSGKSTLARHFNGLLLPESGRVLVDGLDTAKEAELIPARQKVAFVFQNPDNQLVATSVEDDIVFGPENLGIAPQEIGRRLEEALAITGLTDKRHKAPHMLSGGEKQRVAIAGALAMRSAYMVLDEPTSMLDPQLRRSVIGTLQELHQRLGMGLIYVTNIMEEALLAQRILVLHEGRILKDGAPAEIFSDHQWLREHHLALPPVCHVASLLAAAGFPELAGSLSAEELIRRLKGIRGRGIKAGYQINEDASEAPLKERAARFAVAAGDSSIISLKNVFYTYQPGSVHASPALHDISMEIKRGELAALIGHSGSGKSTLAQLITGLMPPGGGEIHVNGVAHSALPKGAIFSGVGLVFQYPEQQLFAETVFDEVAFSPKNMGISEGKLPQLVRQALYDVGLDAEQLWQRSPFTLSGGQKRRLCLASVLAMGAEVLIFDEPAAGLDEGGRQWIIELARRLNSQGKTILWISHNMEEVAELAARILVLSEGSLLFDGSPAEVFAAQEKLFSLGLDIPAAAKLVRQARAEGIDIPGGAITVAGAYDEIAAWLGGRVNA